MQLASIVALKTIHLAFLLQTFFQPEYLLKQYNLEGGNFLQDRKAHRFEKNFQRKSFDVAYLQVRVELHLRVFKLVFQYFFFLK